MSNKQTHRFQALTRRQLLKAGGASMLGGLALGGAAVDGRVHRAVLTAP